jgi:3-oxoadipate enol-lactonase
MELHAEDLACLMDSLEIQQAHLAGISYGGEVSLAFALKYPQRTRSLVVSSAVSHSEPVLRGIIDTWAAAARDRDARRLFDVSYILNFSGAYIEANRQVVEAAAARYADLDMCAVLELLDCFNRMDMTADLHHIQAPTLVMVGEEDILKPRYYSEIIAGKIHGAQLVVVPGAGHALCMERPAVFNTLVLGFLAQLNN